MLLDTLPDLTGPTLTLRPMRASDKGALIAAASDPLIWEQHPASERANPDVMAPYADWLIEEGSLIVLHQGEVAGASRYYEAWNAPGDVAIGYTFLTRAHWGGTANAELKALMFEYAFTQLDRVWLHIAATNERSKAASRKLGARMIEEATHNDALYHCYRVTQEAWRASPAAAIARSAGVAVPQAEH